MTNMPGMTNKQPCFACGRDAVTVAPRYQSCGACGFYWTPWALLPCDSERSVHPVSRAQLRLPLLRNAWKLTGRARTSAKLPSARL